ncbi:uncharacterized protein LOC132114800 [Carassius carassius]|uniref:uncharacterized protein LOC132114795 n=1 Tax=Carassius carassius TaxID=217509 RepID=UPI00286849EF|nr:uncharacterized protein LOC132114795 [Carassius carassius]XP_059379116.1 uncharacterized protein LOC132114800 [Carassius carassius]
MNHWAAILHDYQAIWRLVGNCPALRGRTRIQLFEVNQRTLSVWNNNYRKKLEADVLALSVPLPQISMVSHSQLPLARQMTSMPSAPGSSLKSFPHVANPDLSGQATRRGQRPPPPASAPVLSAQRTASLSAPPAASLSAPATSMSRTTLWRKRKAAEVFAQEHELFFWAAHIECTHIVSAQVAGDRAAQKKSLGTPGICHLDPQICVVQVL